MSQDWYMVIDRAGILDDGQETSAINDTYRLLLGGLPAQVVTENTGLNQEQAERRADELRVSHRIESAPGADDGLLVYASVNARDRSQIVMAVSVGANTLPINGLTQDSLSTIQGTIMATQLADGHPARAIVYSLREMLYLKEFTPPAVEGVSGWRASLGTMIAIVGPVLAIAGAILLIWSGKFTKSWGRSAVARIVGAGCVAVAIAVLGVVSQSGLGILSAIVLGATAIWQAIRLDGRESPETNRVISVTPRPPGSRRHPFRPVVVR